VISAIISRSCGERTVSADNDDSWAAAAFRKSSGASDEPKRDDDEVDVDISAAVVAPAERFVFFFFNALN
jgi:hypothetical protein